MRFTSLIVELVRARPRLIFWVAVLLQAALWFIVPMLFYGSPPGNMASVLAFGREYQVGTMQGPPFAFWLADIAFRLAGNHVFGVYLLSQACFIVTLWAVFTLGRAIVGGQQAVLAVMLTATITVFSFPGVEFGPEVLARPLWALTLLHSWRVMGQGRRNAWFALSIEIGLLLLTTHAAIPLLLILIGFALATKQGRATLMSFDPLLGAMVIAVLALPYAIWAVRAGAVTLPQLPAADALGDRFLSWGMLFGGLLMALAGIALLLIFNSRALNRKPEDAPTIFRPPVDPFARNFVYVFACAPALVLSLLGAALGHSRVFGGDGVTLVMPGLAVIVAAGDLIYLRRQQVLRSIWLFLILAPTAVVLGAALIQPWAGGAEVRTALPATDIGRFFGDSYQRRVNQPLQAVAGDRRLVELIGFAAPSRPHVFFDATPAETPWLTPEKFNQTGGLVVWRAEDTAGTPPADILKRFPDIVPEVPRAFERLVNGRLPLLRIGWAVVRPKAQ
jgi:4-amino-4-deoxy-L-arabinose transferase-like glycosyltransferase